MLKHLTPPRLATIQSYFKTKSDKAQPAGLQSTILAAVFPHAPDTLTVPYGDQAFRRRVMDLLKRIRDVRNRIGHHDSLWTTPEFNHQGILGLIPRRPRHTVNSLQLFADKVCWFAGWIDPHIQTYIKNSDHWWSLQVLLQRRALAIYRQRGGVVGTYRAILGSAELPPRGKKSCVSLRASSTSVW